MMIPRSMRSPFSSQVLGMDIHSQHTEVCFSPGGNPNSQSGTESLNFDMMDDMPTTTTQQSPVSVGKNDGIPNVPGQVLTWYKRSDDPWNPILNSDVTLQRPGRRGQRSNFAGLRTNGAIASFPGSYRAVPSDCGTTHTRVPQSDSGYGSAARHSVGVPSSYGDGDHTADTQSLIEQFQFSRLGSNPFPDNNLWVPQPNPVQIYDQATDAVGDGLWCDHCQQSLKRNSDLNKHKQRHTKPHSCREPGCTRKEGFSTQNDLERHKRSKHPDSVPDGIFYSCTIGACRTKEKKWPRADNFRQHLKRVHQQEISPEDDMEPYLHRETVSNSENDMASYLHRGTVPNSEVLAGLTDRSTGASAYRIGVNAKASIPSSPIQWTGLGQPESSHRTSGVCIESNNQFAEDVDILIGQENLVMDPAARGLDGRSSISRDKNRPQELLPTVLPCQLNVETQSSQPQSAHAQPQPLSPLLPTFSYNVNMASLTFSGSQSQHAATVSSSAHADCDSAQYAAHRTMEEENAAVDGSDCDMEVADADKDAISETHPVSRLPTSESSTGSEGDRSEPKPSSVTADLTQAINGVGDGKDALQIVKSLHDKGILKGMLEELGLRVEGSKPENPARQDVTRRTSASDPVRSRGFAFLCKTCDKSFKRACELRKHTKRHEKPYGCTFPSCDKRFGSKNDWKRHENSQHIRLEMWNCKDAPQATGTADCPKVFNRRETLKHHLEEDHGIRDPAEIEVRLDRCRVGRNNEAWFWCGFCRKGLDIQHLGLQSWSMRFDHIGDHFTGRKVPKRDISEWKYEGGSSETSSSPKSDAGPSTGSPGVSETHEPFSYTSSEKPDQISRSNGKRRADDDAGQARKRRRKDLEDLSWLCCQCHEGVYVLATTSRCINTDCDHSICDACVQAQLKVLEE